MSSHPTDNRLRPRDMSVSYATRLPAHSQALPSFRELLPSHLHDEIESTSYLTSLQHHHPLYHPHTVSASSSSSSPPPSSSSSSPPPSSSSFHRRPPPIDIPAAPISSYPQPLPSAYSATSPSLEQSRRVAAVAAPPPAAPAAPAPPPPTQFVSPPSSHGPSPVLPPIRHLQSLSDTSRRTIPTTNATATPAAGPESSSSSSSFTRDYPSPAYIDAPRAYAVPSHPSLPSGDRQGLSNSYVAAAPGPPPPPPSFFHGQPTYPYIPAGYQTDLNQASVRAIPPHHHHHHHHHHHQPSNFGIISDATDPKSKRRRGNLPKPVTDVLRAWFYEHLDHPYPSEDDKQLFMTRTGLSISQISNWFINARRRQLPALRNQMRSGNGHDGDVRRHSPPSDVDMTSQDSVSSPSSRVDFYR